MENYSTKNHTYDTMYYEDLNEGSQQFISCVVNDMQELHSNRIKYPKNGDTLHVKYVPEDNIFLFVDDNANGIRTRWAVRMISKSTKFPLATFSMLGITTVEVG